MDNSNRQKIIIRTSVLGIVVNILLAGFKAAVGILSNSISVILDAVNNLTDALSSIVTIVGAKIAGKRPDKDHPLGHGRIEYISALVVAAIVLYAGLTSLIESVSKIIEPVTPSYSTTSLVIIAVAVVAKILLGSYVRRKGSETRSGALIASGTDALSDAALSAAVLVTAIIYTLKGISLEAYMGVIISGFIIKAGIEMIGDVVSTILGRRTDSETAKKIKNIVSNDPNVLGVYDLFVHDYGPSKKLASFHVELPDSMTVNEVDVLSRKLAEKVYAQSGVIVTGIGVYSRNSDDEVEKMRRNISDLVLSHEWALQMHGFYFDPEKKTIRFDVVTDFSIKQSEAVEILTKEISEKCPGYKVQIVADIDITD